MKKIVITYGDINGIGFEIMIKALNQLDLSVDDVVIVGSQKVFDFYFKNYGLKLNKNYEIVETFLDERAFEVGFENAFSGEHCFLCLKKACELVNNGVAKNIVTAPVSKHVLSLSGNNYSGQTEVIEKFLAKENEKTEMLFVADDFRVMLLTRHLALNEVAEKLSIELVKEKIIRLNRVLKEKFDISSPKIALLALNPHAGENGILGDEEIKILQPAIKELNDMGINVAGPLVSDAAFAQFGQCYFSKTKIPYDCYVAIYHDQGLIPIKLLAQDRAINTTIGLSAIRTSPSHGTAFDIAGKNIAREDSMVEAIKLALNL